MTNPSFGGPVNRLAVVNSRFIMRNAGKKLNKELL